MDQYVQRHQINAQVNEDTCLAERSSKLHWCVNSFINSCLPLPLRSACKKKWRKLFAACILFLYLTSPLAASCCRRRRRPALQLQHTMHASLCCVCLPLSPSHHWFLCVTLIHIYDEHLSRPHFIPLLLSCIYFGPNSWARKATDHEEPAIA